MKYMTPDLICLSKPEGQNAWKEEITEALGGRFQNKEQEQSLRKQAGRAGESSRDEGQVRNGANLGEAEENARGTRRSAVSLTGRPRGAEVETWRKQG